MSYRGSEWRKWDLHFHTPSSYDYKNKSVTNQELIDELLKNNLSVVAITDHHIIDIARINELKQIADERITILPGIEFLSDSRGKQPIHFIGIFPQNCNLDYVWGQLENRTAIKKINGEGKAFNEVYCNLESTINLIHELGGLVSIHAGEKHSSIENITHSLPHGEAQKTDIAKAIDIYELGKESDQEGYKKFVFPAIGKTIPMIICSDNHNIKNYTLKQNCWIKADPSFEGLKQVIYEPESRIYIGETPPAGAIHKLQKVLLNFHENTQWENSNFCFNDMHEFVFSPYFTSIIGGRGSGKSTLLNLIAKKNGEQIDVLKQIKFSNGQSFENTVSYEPSSIVNLEYLAQNTIEEFAKDSKKFTLAIFERINKIANGALSDFESELSNKSTSIDELITSHKERHSLHQNMSELKKQLNANQSIIEAFNDPAYIKMKTDLSLINGKIQILKTSKQKYESLLISIKNIITANKSIEEPLNEFDNGFNELITQTTNLLSAFESKPFEVENQKIKDLENEKIETIQNISMFLKTKNMNDENIQDISSANSLTESLKADLQKMKKRTLELKKILNTFSFEYLEQLKEQYKVAINIELLKINDKFRAIQETNPNDVKLIKVQYKENTDLKNQIIEKLNNKLSLESRISSVRSTFLDYMFRISPDDILRLNYQQYIEKLSEKCNTGTKAFEVLNDIFANSQNFKILQLIIRQCQLDFKANKVLEVLYDEKSLEKSSFGQRCTAAIVVLLSLGNNPIIIDEPEAHLDSSLIANYLVELIKEQKQHRQIIFATHNANFVINADAELIIKLDNINGQSSHTSFSIENLEHRESLLKLEGGVIAFKKREQKYNI